MMSKYLYVYIVQFELIYIQYTPGEYLYVNNYGNITLAYISQSSNIILLKFFSGINSNIQMESATVHASYDDVFQQINGNGNIEFITNSYIHIGLNLRNWSNCGENFLWKIDAPKIVS